MKSSKPFLAAVAASVLGAGAAAHVNFAPFAALVEQQKSSAVPVALPNSMFDRWVEGSDSILHNPVPGILEGR